MAETDKLNIDSIIARLLEGKCIVKFVSLHLFWVTTQSLTVIHNCGPVEFTRFDLGERESQ
jgi:hypothetical protein